MIRGERERVCILEEIDEVIESLAREEITSLVNELMKQLGIRDQILDSIALHLISRSRAHGPFPFNTGIAPTSSPFFSLSFHHGTCLSSTVDICVRASTHANLLPFHNQVFLEPP